MSEHAPSQDPFCREYSLREGRVLEDGVNVVEYMLDDAGTLTYKKDTRKDTAHSRPADVDGIFDDDDRESEQHGSDGGHGELEASSDEGESAWA